MFLILMKSSLSVISCMDHIFGVVSKKSSPYPKSSRFSPMLYSRSFIVLHFNFRSMIPFELIFVQDVRSISRFLFPVCGCPVYLPYFFQKTIFSPQYCFALLSRSEDYFMMVHFWLPHSVPLTCLFSLSKKALP